MDFLPNPDQQHLIEQAQSLVDRQFSSAHVREAEASVDGFPRALWDAGVDFGWSGLLVADEFGGAGGDLLDMCLLVEATARAGATLPLVVSSGVAVTMLETSPPSGPRDALLRTITAGRIVAPALIDAQARNEWDPASLPLRVQDDGTYRMSGTKMLVAFASAATELLVTVATDDGRPGIVAVDAAAEGVTITRHLAKVGVPLAAIEFADVVVPAERLIHQGEEAVAAIHAGLQTGSLLATAEAVGWVEALIALTVDHVTTRQAFDRPIGAFQAVAHPCADMRISSDAVRILLQQAAWTVDNGGDAGEAVPAMKAIANEQFERVSNDAYRLHGALAFSTECDVQLFTRRLQGYFGSFGETNESFERAASAAGI